MENRELDLDRWVDRCLAALEAPAEWRPDAAQAYPRLPEVDGRMRRRRRQRLLVTAVGAAACLAVALIEAPKAYCAAAGCANRTPARVSVAVPVPAPSAVRPAAPQAAARPAPPARPETSATANFKVQGSASAPITCEIYSDYECPHCAIAFRDVIPLLVADYVQTGKVRLVHRDMPLPQHTHARLAARYANAAGRLGEYDVVAAQIFRTQATWSATGDIDAPVAEVLPPGDMQKVREMVHDDPSLDDSVTADFELARQDRITATPSVVVVKNGHREVLSPLPSYELLKTYLDGLLGPR